MVAFFGERLASLDDRDVIQSSGQSIQQVDLSSAQVIVLVHVEFCEKVVVRNPLITCIVLASPHLCYRKKQLCTLMTSFSAGETVKLNGISSQPMSYAVGPGFPETDTTAFFAVCCQATETTMVFMSLAIMESLAKFQQVH
jgi:hypothetical protein